MRPDSFQIHLQSNPKHRGYDISIGAWQMDSFFAKDLLTHFTHRIKGGVACVKCMMGTCGLGMV